MFGGETKIRPPPPQSILSGASSTQEFLGQSEGIAAPKSLSFPSPNPQPQSH